MFEARARALGIPSAPLQLILDGNIRTMGQFAFCCAFQPGAADEAPLIVVLTTLPGGAPNIGLMSGLRRLFYQAHTLDLIDMRGRMGTTEEPRPRQFQLHGRVG